jgi:asparagine synthase (glutamine-hydrolysing)
VGLAQAEARLTVCGINGIFAYHPAAGMPDRSELLATRDYMQLRGPDGAGVWWSQEGRLGFGHRRLSIIDLSERATQPMVREDGRFVITFNGEIYNYAELRTELEAQGVRFRTSSDTETILHLYARYGAEMVGRLRGMFAFAIWDHVSRVLFLARDPYGIKPLYTADDGWTFRFASQVKALLAGGRVSRDPEPAGIVGFNIFGNVPEPFTLYREIRALPAGHAQIVDAAGPREPKPFVNLAAILRDGARQQASAVALDATVREAVRDSVRAHLVADVEVGVFLSAGVDSSALLGLMCEAGASNPRAITLAFEEFRGTEEDEAPLAAQVAERYGARHIVRHVSEREFKDDVPAIFAAMDQPSIDGVNTWFVSKAAREQGLKVAISGLGGDELLAGYPSFTQVPRWRRQFGTFARMAGLGWLARASMELVAPGLVRTRPKALGLLEYAGTWQGAYLLRRALFLPRELRQMMDADLVREGLRRLRPLHYLAAFINPDPGSDVGRVCALESGHYMRNQLLRDSDWAGMAHGLEIRVPLVDIALFKTLSPLISKLTPGAGKAALAAAPSPPLPAAILGREKTGFGVPTGAWMASASRATPGELGLRKGAISRRWSRVVLEALSPRAEVLNP